MPAHILIVEDDENIAHMIEATLTIGGYTSEVRADGESALTAILNRDYDLILLDIMLPKIDGFTLFERKGNKPTPVIFLTAMGDVPSKVKGLRMGAEDYIVKPFEAVELLARIEVVLRRTQAGEATLTYRNITVDVSRHHVLADGREVALTPKEFDLLAFFIRNVDIALTRERLLSAVWGYSYVGETRTVDTHIQQLRKKLDLHEALVTIPRLGYRLERSDAL
ncbi:MAG: response regulator transcription factor [Coriobacteriales bacterium]|jgi:DNA-binding response OmpR family regulator|nr:response regulator transcription factor [Coriobacteriales bacterium]